MADKIHPIYKKFKATPDGQIINIETGNRPARQRNSADHCTVEVHLGTSRENRTRKLVKDLVYESFYGNIPDDHHVVLRSNDREDCSQANLELISTEERDHRLADERNVLRREKEAEGWRTHPIYTDYMAHASGSMFSLITQKQANPAADMSGRLSAKIVHENKRRSVCLNRIVWESFNGVLEDDLDAYHLDGNGQNNELSNLEALTVSEHFRLTLARRPELHTNVANTISKAVVRIDADMLIEPHQFPSMKDAVASDNQANHTALLTAIRSGEEYLGYHWEFKEFADLPGEIWKEIDEPAFVGFKFSNLGRIHTRYNKTFGSKFQDGFVININGQRYNVHFVICRAFHGAPPTGPEWERLSVDHIDQQHGNNKEENLRWSNPDLQMRNTKRVYKVQSYFLDTGESIQQFDSASDAMRICRRDHDGKGFDCSSITKCCNKRAKHSGKIDGRKVGWRQAPQDA